jgi:cyclophilin family peptidyl-prolyl cis-trans isomerase
LKHKYGALGAARDNNPQMASSGSQFYIVVNKNGTPHLDGKYTVFGEVVEGMDVAEKIAAQQRSNTDRPLTNIPMTVTIVKMKLSKLTKAMQERATQLQSR